MRNPKQWTGALIAATLVLLTGCDPKAPQETSFQPTEIPQTRGEVQNWTATTLNTYWFMDPPEAPGDRGDPPETKQQKTTKVENLTKILISTMRGNPPLIIGLQEIGSEDELELLATAFKAETGVTLLPLFKKGRDTFTGQNVGALYNPNLGWKLVGRADRHSDLEKEVSKHLTFTLEKGNNRLTCIVVHLRVPRDGEANIAQQNQIRAILRYTQRFLKNPEANLLVMGDFNEKDKVGSPSANINILIQNGPMWDTSEAITGPNTTHQKVNRTLDRILISASIGSGAQGIKAENVWTVPHDLDPKTGTDHYPVTLLLKENKL